MPSGKTHEWATLVLLPAVWLACRWGFHLGNAVSLWIVVGTWVGGFLLSPDLDIRSRPFYRWGVFRFIWWPYQWMVKHRSGLSHGILFASWLRLIYLSAVLILFYLGASLTLSHYWAHTPLALSSTLPYQGRMVHFVKQNLNNILWLGVGVWLGSLLHILLDRVGSSFGKKRKRR